jgi:DivIVA domain-containing protein
VALDRQSIMRDDFPTNRRGYDPSAVDAHLDRIATEVEDLERRAAAPPPAPVAAPLSAQAGEQVKAIVEAAERSAQEIRDAAHAEARDHVAGVTAAADRLRERIDQMERDVTQLVIALREGADRLRGDLGELQAGTGALAAAEAPAAEPAAPPAAAAPPEPAAPPAEAAPAKNGDAAAARIVALDMALSGSSREDTDQYLADHYDLPDRAALLDEVYAAAGG